MTNKNKPKLEVSDLSVKFFTDEGQINAANRLDLAVRDGEIFGIVGESGSGKSVTARALLGIVHEPGEITEGEVLYRNAEIQSQSAKHPEAIDLCQLSPSALRGLRASKFSMVFQDAQSGFDPIYSVGEQIAEAIEAKKRMDGRSPLDGVPPYRLSDFLASKIIKSQEYISDKSYDEAIELLRRVGIPDPEHRVDDYPHEYSGGMLQRAMIAMALATEPDVLIADEPTTALDVTTQAEILELLKEIQNNTNMTIIIITHNLGVVARICDRVGVMYAGEIVETGPLRQILTKPTHPYTKGLISCIPDMDDPDQTIEPIKGDVPSLRDAEMDGSCKFMDRCPDAMDKCKSKPKDYVVNDDAGHTAKCYLAHEDSDDSVQDNKRSKEVPAMEEDK